MRVLPASARAQRPYHHVEHNVAKQHGGSDEPADLALVCHRCNLRKGPHLGGIDPSTQAMIQLFYPRQDRWDDHFRLRVRIEGIAPTATVQVLAMNDARRTDLGAELLVRGGLP